VRKYKHTHTQGAWVGLVIHLFGRPIRPENLHSALDIRLGFQYQAQVPTPPFDPRPFFADHEAEIMELNLKPTHTHVATEREKGEFIQG